MPMILLETHTNVPPAVAGACHPSSLSDAGNNGAWPTRSSIEAVLAQERERLPAEGGVRRAGA